MREAAAARHIIFAFHPAKSTTIAARLSVTVRNKGEQRKIATHGEVAEELWQGAEELGRSVPGSAMEM